MVQKCLDGSEGLDGTERVDVSERLDSSEGLDGRNPEPCVQHPMLPT